jgi:hypothetical protein
MHGPMNMKVTALYNMPHKDGFPDVNSGSDLITAFFSVHPVYLKLFSFVRGRWEFEAMQRRRIPRDVICTVPASLLSVL